MVVVLIPLIQIDTGSSAAPEPSATGEPSEAAEDAGSGAANVRAFMTGGAVFVGGVVLLVLIELA